VRPSPDLTVSAPASYSPLLHTPEPRGVLLAGDQAAKTTSIGRCCLLLQVAALRIAALQAHGHTREDQASRQPTAAHERVDKVVHAPLSRRRQHRHQVEEHDLLHSGGSGGRQQQHQQ
jgi:hypothetical protein